MTKRIFSLAVLLGVLFSLAGAVRGESSYSPVTVTSSSPISAASSGATSTYFATTSGNWNASGSWNGGVPTSSMTAYIGGNSASGFTASLSSAASAGYLYLGTGSGSYVGAGTLGMTACASLNVANSVYVGYQSGGTLTLAGASLNSGAAYLGGSGAAYTGATGSVSVSGPGAVWNCGSAICAGYYGPGMLSITSGGAVSDISATVGGSEGTAGTGTVTVDGTNSKWTNLGGLTVGYGARGTLNISNGASVTAGTGSPSYIGYLNGVSASPSVVSVRSGGALSTGTAYISSPAPPTVSNLGGTGDVSIDGAGSSWTIGGASSYLYVGGYGNGTLNITNGATVYNTAGTGAYGATFVGGNPDWIGTINFGSAGGTLATRTLFASPSQVTGTGAIDTNGLVTDANLVFNSPASLTQSVPFGTTSVNLSPTAGTFTGLGVGWRGTGTLTINNGQTVSSAAAYLGVLPGSNGSATVSGSGTVWNAATSGGAVIIGDSGAGSLLVSGGATFDTAGLGASDPSGSEVDIGNGDNTTGTMTVDGSGTKAYAYSCIVGSGCAGTLNITNGDGYQQRPAQRHLGPPRYDRQRRLGDSRRQRPPLDLERLLANGRYK